MSVTVPLSPVSCEVGPLQIGLVSPAKRCFHKEMYREPSTWMTGPKTVSVLAWLLHVLVPSLLHISEIHIYDRVKGEQNEHTGCTQWWWPPEQWERLARQLLNRWWEAVSPVCWCCIPLQTHTYTKHLHYTYQPKLVDAAVYRLCIGKSDRFLSCTNKDSELVNQQQACTRN